MLTYLTSFLAGSLSTLSPCVLPALPLIVGGTTQGNRRGPFFLALGLVIGFTIIGLSIAQFGHILGLNPKTLRDVSAVMLIFSGILFLSARAQLALSKFLAPVVQYAGIKSSRISSNAPFKQFGLGLLMGAVWSPCVGPTLGTAIGLATNSETVGQATGMMLLYGVGAALPLFLVAQLQVSTLRKSQSKIMAWVSKTKIFMGASLIMTGLFVLSGLDQKLAAQFLEVLPDVWLNFLTII